MKESRTYPLRLPRSLKEAVERLSREDRTSVNQFVTMAVAEKVSAPETARLFADRKVRAIMCRRGGQPPREGDEMPRRAKVGSAK